jgi:hypothetical protein
MSLIRGVVGKEFGTLVQFYIVHSELHGADQIVLQRWDVDGLMKNQDHHLARGGVIICQRGADYLLVGDSTKRWVISCDIYLSAKVLEYVRVPSNKACVGVVVDFSAGIVTFDD